MRLPFQPKAPKSEKDLSLDPEVKELQEPTESEWQVLNYVDDQFKTAADHRRLWRSIGRLGLLSRKAVNGLG
jgi:hypothetical protein